MFILAQNCEVLHGAAANVKIGAMTRVQFHALEQSLAEDYKIALGASDQSTWVWMCTWRCKECP